MLQIVPVAPRPIEDLRPVVGDEGIDRLRAAAEPLAGARVLHVNSTAYGGGVAELLATQVGLMNELGLHTDWQVIDGSPEFFEVTKRVHNALQGADAPWTAEMERVYLERSRENAQGLARGYDFVIVHDPQPCAILSALEDAARREGRWVWRCHIDLSDPNETVWDFYASHVDRYDGVIFTMEDFVRPGLTGPRTFVVPPSIDPVSDKNRVLDPGLVEAVLLRYGVDPARPLVTQVSRFDPWKDPMGVIDAYRIARERVPGVQLALLASMADDDPEGHRWLERTQARRGGDPDIHLLSNLDGIGNVEVNAFQRASAVVVQKSLREGFGLVVAEALWKGRPVVGGNVGGIRLQIQDGVDGYLVDSVAACADRVAHLLESPEDARRMGESGRERVRRNFLTAREVVDYLRVLSAVGA